ncbi:MAG: hypothetical protein ACLQJ7_00325 [Syntrophobacteraceae bacterium]
MGFLQNHAIKKSCKGLAKELLNDVASYISQLPENNKSNDFAQLMLAGLKNFVDTFRPFPGVNLDLKSIRCSDHLELYFMILIKLVYADLSYDPFIGTYEHNTLIVKIGGQVLNSCRAQLEMPYPAKAVFTASDFIKSLFDASSHDIPLTYISQSCNIHKDDGIKYDQLVFEIVCLTLSVSYRTAESFYRQIYSDSTLSHLFKQQLTTYMNNAFGHHSEHAVDMFAMRYESYASAYDLDNTPLILAKLYAYHINHLQHEPIIKRVAAKDILNISLPKPLLKESITHVISVIDWITQCFDKFEIAKVTDSDFIRVDPSWSKNVNPLAEHQGQEKPLAHFDTIEPASVPPVKNKSKEEIMQQESLRATKTCSICFEESAEFEHPDHGPICAECKGLV